MRSFTLLELIVVVIILGILVALAVPNFTRAIENARDKEAFVNLKLIQAAQRIHFMKTGRYVRCLGGWESDQESCINRNLGLNLPPGGPGDRPTWDYETYGDNGDTAGCTHCQRRGGDSRRWHLRIGGQETREGVCSSLPQ